jgi:glucokinase
MSLLAIDFGGTRMRAAWADIALDGLPRLLVRAEQPTRAADHRDVLFERMVGLAHSVIPAGSRPRAIGIAAPGPHDAATGVIYHSYALPGWQDVPLGAMLEDALGAPVYMQNDGNLGALAEWHGGAGRETSPMLYMTVSTGIGGGVMLNGSLFTGWSGLAAEPGHMLVRTETGEDVRLEAVASGTALGLHARAMLARTDEPSSLRAVDEVDGAAVGRAAQAGDGLALTIVERAGSYLGIGLVNLLHLFSPQAVVVGGSVSRLGDLLFDPARRTIDRLVLDPRFVPPDFIRLAHYGEDVCLAGGALWAHQHTG